MPADNPIPSGITFGTNGCEITVRASHEHVSASPAVARGWAKALLALADAVDPPAENLPPAPIPAGVSIGGLFDALAAEREARAERIAPAVHAEIRKILEGYAGAFEEGGDDDIAVARAILRRRAQAEAAPPEGAEQ